MLSNGKLSVGAITSTGNRKSRLECEETLQKATIPELINKTAIATKNGPAAPVTLSAHRSRALKQRNTVREQII